jgi:hypothetical protein
MCMAKAVSMLPFSYREGIPRVNAMKSARLDASPEGAYPVESWPSRSGHEGAWASQ